MTTRRTGLLCRKGVSRTNQLKVRSPLSIGTSNDGSRVSRGLFLARQGVICVVKRSTLLANVMLSEFSGN